MVVGEQPPDTNQHVHQRAIFYIQTLSAHIFNERNRSSTRSGGKFTRSNEQKSEKKDHPARKAGLMSLSEQLDILICILPKVSPDAPTVGPSLLKSHCQAAGFTCEVVDLNIKLYNAVKDKLDRDEYWYTNDKIWRADDLKLTAEFSQLMHESKDTIDDWIDSWRKLNPRFIGLSLLSHMSNAMAIYMSREIKQHLPNVKVVWGGASVGDWARDLYNDNVVDYVILGDAEITLIELLKGNVDARGINDFKSTQLDDLETMLTPNYDDINWQEYDDVDGTQEPVYITGSRGCVKKCTFCDVANIWPTYRYRAGKSIASELITIRRKYKRRTFMFTDSLINGSMKSFREMMNELREYRQIDSSWRWSSQWIIRSKKQSLESDFALMWQSGCRYLDIGVESFSQDVRYHMGKKFSDADMWHTFELLRKYNISASVLMFVGYPTETDADHQITLDTIHRLAYLGYLTRNDQGQRLNLSFSSTCMITKDLPLYELVKDELKNHKSSREWDYRSNTLAVRLQRYAEIYELLQQLYTDKFMNKYAVRNLLHHHKLKTTAVSRPASPQLP